VYQLAEVVSHHQVAREQRELTHLALRLQLRRPEVSAVCPPTNVASSRPPLRRCGALLAGLLRCRFGRWRRQRAAVGALLNSQIGDLAALHGVRVYGRNSRRAQAKGPGRPSQPAKSPAAGRSKAMTMTCRASVDGDPSQACRPMTLSVGRRTPRWCGVLGVRLEPLVRVVPLTAGRAHRARRWSRPVRGALFLTGSA